MAELRDGELYGTPQEVDAYRIMSAILTITGGLDAAYEGYIPPENYKEVIRISIHNLKCVEMELAKIHNIDGPLLAEYYLRLQEKAGRLEHTKVEAAIAQIRRGEPMTPVYVGQPRDTPDEDISKTFEGAYHA